MVHFGPRHRPRSRVTRQRRPGIGAWLRQNAGSVSQPQFRSCRHSASSSWLSHATGFPTHAGATMQFTSAAHSELEWFVQGSPRTAQNLPPFQRQKEMASHAAWLVALQRPASAQLVPQKRPGCRPQIEQVRGTLGPVQHEGANAMPSTAATASVILESVVPCALARRVAQIGCMPAPRMSRSKAYDR
jgi:hypothetical protein